MRTPCAHTFCRSCLDQSLKRTSQCPLCKTAVNRRAICPDLRAVSMVLTFRDLKEAYEDVAEIALSQAPMRRYKAEPIVNFSQVFPYPVKQSASESNENGSLHETIPEEPEDDEEEPDIDDQSEVSFSSVPEPQLPKLVSSSPNENIPLEPLMPLPIAIASSSQQQQEEALPTPIQHMDGTQGRLHRDMTPLTAVSTDADLSLSIEDLATGDISSQMLEQVKNKLLMNLAEIDQKLEAIGNKKHNALEPLSESAETAHQTPSMKRVLCQESQSAAKQTGLRVQVLTSSLDVKHMKILDELVQQLGGSICQAYSDSVTHLVTSTGIFIHRNPSDPRLDENNRAHRTLKYFHAVANGIWIVGHAWLEKCLEEGTWVDPSAFEVGGCEDFGVPGPRRSRLVHQDLSQHSKPLTGLEFHLEGTYGSLSIQDVCRLIVAMGGRVVDGPTMYIMLGLETLEDEVQQLAERYSATADGGTKFIPCTYLLDCISCYEKLDDAEYALELGQAFSP